MLNNILFITLYFFTINSFALDCIDDTEISLSKQGERLHQYRTSDQDGFGTCYANALSTAIYTLTGEEVSYHQIALEYQSLEYTGENSETRTDRLGAAGIDTSESNLRINEGGDSCKALEALKKSQKICSRDSFQVENLFDPSRQKVGFHEALATFYDEAKAFRQLPPWKKKWLLDKIPTQSNINQARIRLCNQTVSDFLQGKKDSIDEILRGKKTVENLIRFKFHQYKNKLLSNLNIPNKEVENNLLKNRIFKLLENFTIMHNEGPKTLRKPEDLTIEVLKKIDRGRL